MTAGDEGGCLDGDRVGEDKKTKGTAGISGEGGIRAIRFIHKRNTVE